MNKKNKMKPKKGLKNILFRLTVASVGVYLIVSFATGQFQIAEKRQELQRLEEQLKIQSDANIELESMMEEGSDEAYIERVAREKLGYALPQERVFVDLTGE